MTGKSCWHIMARFYLNILLWCEIAIHCAFSARTIFTAHSAFRTQWTVSYSHCFRSNPKIIAELCRGKNNCMAETCKRITWKWRQLHHWIGISPAPSLSLSAHFLKQTVNFSSVDFRESICTCFSTTRETSTKTRDPILITRNEKKYVFETRHPDAIVDIA